MPRSQARVILVLMAALAAGMLVWWLAYNPTADFMISLPGMDNKGKGGQLPPEEVIIGDSFLKFAEIPEIKGTRWPNFRGIDFDNISKERISLIEKFGKKGPEICWKLTLGEGHAAPAVYDGRVYLLDYDELKRSDMLRCFSLETGKELWRRWYHVKLKRNHGLSRTIPAVNEKFVLSIGPKCQVMCVDRIKGDLKWGLDLAREYKTEVPFWYTGQCPLLVNDTAVLAVGGSTLMIGVDCNTGKKLWETPNPHQWKMSHSSVMPMLFKGKKMFVYIAIGGICGISASGPDIGKILWESNSFSPSVVAPSPCILDNGKILFTAGYGAGSVLVQVKEDRGSYTAAILQQYKPLDGLASEQQTPIFFNGHIYGIQPKDAGSSRNQFVCYKSDDCMKQVMSSGKDQRFGLGPYILADGKFFILNDDGELSIAKASPSGFMLLDRQKIIEGQDSWGPLAITGGYLIMRDSKQMVCLDIKAK